MDQHQATSYILDRLKLGYSKVDIAADVSQRMGAPPDLVMRFVNKVADLQIQQNSSPDNEGTAPHDDQEAFEPSNESVYEWEPKDQEVSYGSYPDEEAVFDNIPEEFTINGTTPPDQEVSYGAYPDEGVVLDNILEESAFNGTAPPDQEKYKSEKMDIDLEALTRFVVQSLKKHQRFNDIVESVCQRTGMTWNQAQRFVARTQTKHHKELTKSSRSIMLPLSIGFIIGGLLLLIWSIVTMFDYYNAFMGQDFSTLPVEFIVVVGGVFVSSLGIMAGGAYVLYRTLSSH